ncbi:MAG: BACON domain-containing protein, partial [Alistipes sp.]|nr:BACON domain-containing protein [Alistipes sp.]
MKKLFLLLAAVGMIFTACEPANGLDEDNNGNNGNNTEQPGGGDQGGEDIPTDAYIGLNKDAVTISPDGGSVDVTVYSNYKWTLSTSCDWCTASMSGGEANEDGVVVTLSADVAYDDREATFLFSCGNAKKVLIVSQKFKETIIADENNTFNVPAEGGVVEIAYQTTVECEVVIPQNAQSWISITPETRALASEKATLTVAENTTYSDREAVVKVVKVGDNTLFAEYTISQVQNDAVIAENNTLNVGGWQHNATIQYQTNVECEVVIPDDCKEWISVVPETRALSRNSVTLDFADNNTGAERKGVVQVVAVNNKELVAEYSVTQNQRY